jgi:hypothetical protein
MEEQVNYEVVIFIVMIETLVLFLTNLFHPKGKNAEYVPRCQRECITALDQKC